MRFSWQAFEEKFGPVVSWGGPQYYTGGNTLSALLTLAKHRAPRRVLEIGTAFGHTTVALARTLPDARLWTIDISHEKGFDPTSPYASEVLPRAKVGHAIQSEARPLRERIVSIVDAPDRLHEAIRHERRHGGFDFIFIDGDHRWASVVRDTKLALDVAAEGAVIAWDDYSTAPGVGALVDTLNRTDDRIVAVEPTRLAYTVLDPTGWVILSGALAELT